MPKVVNPASGASKSDSTFEWTMDDTEFVSSLVIVGSAEGSDDVYAGTAIPKANGTKDNNVHHPRDEDWYFTRVKFQVTSGGTWYTTGSEITAFFSE